MFSGILPLFPTQSSYRLLWPHLNSLTWKNIKVCPLLYREGQQRYGEGRLSQRNTPGFNPLCISVHLFSALSLPAQDVPLIALGPLGVLWYCPSLWHLSWPVQVRGKMECSFSFLTLIFCAIYLLRGIVPSSRAWMWILALSHTSCVTLDKPFNLSVPQFLHLHGNSDAISSKHGVRANHMSPPVLLLSLSQGDGKGQSALTTLLIKGILGAWDGV